MRRTTSGSPPANTRPLASADLDLVAALQAAPRASVRLLAEVLDTSVSTVSRRLTRLRDQHVLRVVGQVPWSVFSDSHPHHVWITTRPGHAGRVADEIAGWSQARFVAVTTGQSDVYCILHPQRREQVADLLAVQLPAAQGVAGTHSELGLRMYASAPTWRLPRLRDDQLHKLSAVFPPPFTGEPFVQLSEEESRAAVLLQQDGRATAAEAARLLDVSSSTAYRMLHSLLERGIVRPRVEIEPALLGYPLEAVLSLHTAPHSTPEVADALGMHASARYVSTIAGRCSIIHHGVFRNEDHLADFLTHDLAELPGITALEVAIVLHILTRYWSPPAMGTAREASG